MAFLYLTRPINLFFVVLAQVLCAIYILNLSIDYRLILFFIGSALITAAGYVINDYFDIKADAINKPNKVYVGREISRRKALLFVFTLNLSTVILSFVGNQMFIYIYTFLTIVGLWFYSYQLKRTFLIGNILIAFLGGFSIYIHSYLGKPNTMLLAFSLFALLSNLIREIIKDAEEIKGDLLLNAKTLPIVLGIKNTKIVVSILSLLFLVAIWVGFVQHNDFKLVTSVLVVSSLLFYVQYLIWYTQNTHLAFKKSSQILKIIMLIGCLSIPLL